MLRSRNRFRHRVYWLNYRLLGKCIQTRAWVTFLERLASQVYIIPLYRGLNPVILSNRVRDFLPNPNVITNNWNIADWWVA